MTKAIIFDIGGVLVGLDFDRCVESFHRIGFSKIDQMLDCCHQKGYFKTLESGEMSEQEFIDAVKADSSPGTPDDDVRRAFDSFLDAPSDEKAALIRKLHSEGYKLYLLSNNNPITMAWTAELFREKGMPMELFSAQFISAYMKVQKPSREIFDKAVETIGLPREELLFIDDSMRNVEAGLAAGIPSVFYDINTPLADTVLPNIKK
ncbi:MAG: HAD family phosphatase [Bacteroidales bacterium]|nr:HAD family phosphatase [Bacteroidales bacterium]